MHGQWELTIGRVLDRVAENFSEVAKNHSERTNSFDVPRITAKNVDIPLMCGILITTL